MDNVFGANRIGLGLMRLENVSIDELERLIKQCLILGISFFDVSDIYCNGESERKLGEVLKRNPGLRDKMIIQTKGGIVKNNEGKVEGYDLSYSYIKKACDASLQRLQTTYVDSYLFHRPDIFIDSEEAAKAVEELFKEGKIKHFGVSNFSSSAMSYLQSEMKDVKIEVNQLQAGLGHMDIFSSQMNTNMNNEEGIDRDNGVFYYMKEHKIVLQCWSPYLIGFFQGNIFTDPRMKKTNDIMEELSQKYSVSKCGIATAFLLSLTKETQVITGSMNINHIKETLEGVKVNLTKAEWYRLYTSTGHFLP